MLQNRCQWIFALVVCMLVPAAAAAAPRDELVVHEWGTFTSLQNENGQPLAGINIDDEPVPTFVHNLNPYILQSSYALREVFSKGAPQRHPFVTVRLETPVIYFYPPQSQRGPMKVDVDVSFRGGWLTEFYPNAMAFAPGLKENSFEFGPITPQTVGRIFWRDVTVGTDRPGPETNEHVWTAPRRTEATPVTIPEGEAEKYLFYRGVGNFSAPLSISHNAETKRLAIRGNFGEVLTRGEQANINGAWLVHIRADGKTAFRRIDSFTATSDTSAVIATVKSQFEEQEYKAVNMEKLREQMHKSLVAEGLFEDEAYAMLSTWERAYFQKPGLRVFFTVPRQWTDYRLPLHLSTPAKIERVMVGRIELVSPEQRATLNRLAQTAISDGRWISKVWESPNAQSFLSGHSDFGDLGVQIPADYQMYLDLGRFRNALVVAEARQRPTESLQKFIRTYQLEQFNVPGTGVAALEHDRSSPGGGQ